MKEQLACIPLILATFAGLITRVEIIPEERKSELLVRHVCEQRYDHHPEQPNTNALRELRNVYVSTAANTSAEAWKKFQATLDIGSKSGQRFNLS